MFKGFNSSEVRNILLNFSFRSFAILLSKFLGLITLPIITRALGPEHYGYYSLVILIVTYTSLPVNMLGMRNYGIREIASGRKEKTYVSNIMSLQMLVALISVFLSLIISFFIFNARLALFSAIVLGYVIVFAKSLNLEFFFVSQKKLFFPTIANLIGQLFYMMGVVLLIRLPEDYVLLVFLYSLTPVVSSIIQIVRYQKSYSPIKFKFSLLELYSTFKKTFRLGISQNLEGFIPTIPQILIPFFLGSYALGIFSGGYKVYLIMVMFYVSLFYAIAPYLVQMNKYPISKLRKYHLLLLSGLFIGSSLIGLVLFFFGDEIVTLILGKSFGDSILVFKMISLTLIPFSPVVMLFGNIFIYSKLEKYYLYALMFSGIITVISSPILMNYFQVIGAVYALSLSIASQIILLVYFYFTKFNLSLIE